MAPFGPVPEMVSKLRSRKCAPSARKSANFRAASISLTVPGEVRSSQARNRQMAKPSRSWAATMPASSMGFLQARGMTTGSLSATGVPRPRPTAAIPIPGCRRGPRRPPRHVPPKCPNRRRIGPGGRRSPHYRGGRRWRGHGRHKVDRPFVKHGEQRAWHVAARTFSSQAIDSGEVNTKASPAAANCSAKSGLAALVRPVKASPGDHRRQRRRRLVGPNRVVGFRQRYRRRPDVASALSRAPGRRACAATGRSRAVHRPADGP